VSLARYIEVLRDGRLFKGISDEDIGTMLEVMRELPVKKGDVVMAQGSVGDTMVVVLDGILRVQATDKAGAVADLGSVRAGEVVGEMAVLDPAPRSASIIAATDGLLAELSREDLRALRVQAPAVSAAIVAGVIADLTRRLRQVNERIDLELNPDKVRSDQDGVAKAKAAASGFFSRIGALWSRLRGGE
jgi:CRP/FNR family cyclic AMP-dependent transcriptional regulator